MALGHGASIVRDGLVLHLDAASVKSYPGSGTLWKDLSGNGNDGTLVNGPSFDSANKGSIGFDGVNDYGDIGSITPDTGDFSVGFLYQITGISGRGGLFERRPDGHYNGFSLGQGGSNSWGGIISGTSNFLNKIDIYFDYPLTNTWYYDVVIYTNGNTITGYRNGEFVDSSTGISQGNLSTEGTRTNFLIANRDNSSAYLPCKVGIIQVYNRALSQTEIQQNFEAIRSRYGV